MTRGITPLLIFTSSLLLLALVWQLLPGLLNVPEYVFPNLSSIYSAVAHHEPALEHLLLTAYEAFLGFLLGSAVGFLLGVGMAESKVIRSISLPYIVGSNAIPVIALAPLLIILFGNGIGPKVATAAFLCFFPLCQNTYKSLLHYPPNYRDIFTIYGSRRRDFLLRYKLPHSLPSIFSGLRLNATYAVVGAVVAEFIGASSGLGYGIIQASHSLNMPRMWGYILLSCFLGLLFYGIVYIFERVILIKFKMYE